MKRYNNLYNKILNVNNLLLAHLRAKKGKSNYASVLSFEKNINSNILKLNQSLISGTHTTSQYSIDTRIERGKERVIYKLPYFPDRILHHAILQIIQPILEQTYIKDTYQSIKGRGIHKAKDRVKFFLKDKENTQYCLKMDIRKYYPSVNNEILKRLTRKKIKCKETLKLLDEIIDSTKGLPIGNYTSQTLGNYYLSYFDHWVKEELKEKYYIRYADDMTIFHSSKKHLHEIKNSIEIYLKEELGLDLKSNWQVFKTEDRGVDFLGFKFYHTHILLRKSIAKAFTRIVSSRNIDISKINGIMSYYGWIKASNSYNLLRNKITKQLILNIDMLCKKVKIRSPSRLLITVPTKSRGNKQLTFNF